MWRRKSLKTEKRNSTGTLEYKGKMATEDGSAVLQQWELGGSKWKNAQWTRKQCCHPRTHRCACSHSGCCCCSHNGCLRKWIAKGRKGGKRTLLHGDIKQNSHARLGAFKVPLLKWSIAKPGKFGPCHSFLLMAFTIISWDNFVVILTVNGLSEETFRGNWSLPCGNTFSPRFIWLTKLPVLFLCSRTGNCCL